MILFGHHINNINVRCCYWAHEF